MPTYICTYTYIVHTYIQISQEIGLIPEDPDYINPFRTSEVTVNNQSLKCIFDKQFIF